MPSPFSPSSSSLSERLRAQADHQWRRATEHPMTDALADGTVPPEAMTVYLIEDHKFLDAFVVLVASVIAHAPSLKDRIPAAQFLGMVTSRENTFFERSFEALKVPQERRDKAASPTSQAFIDLMLDAAKSQNLHEMLSVLLVAEWSYLTWAERVHPKRGQKLPFWCSEWIDLHRGEGFEAFVGFLRELLDRVGESLTGKEMEACRERFNRAIELEGDFWDMAWGCLGGVA
uniref:Thiaminase-2/PQQC domain-containing protein n=1 Tax=Chromera velia CCMP2878 TaxID=1169474 RepID=A0A0G4F6R9_9ALVE|eukprot:Cvel_15313.t1-p1 / transcript=Cvel_15313.t1 / gene=Cvel_15313 / organism=Chromera_velia_CCMP2878 / gene_product=Protein PET18, putative / transcript_product=Protein PET18, putative / location=Cvel_scaffold1125:48323-49388(+) / protein_length=230 / sequence_SO=supercontig / SO=protein_coding / is_pseudo=false